MSSWSDSSPSNRPSFLAQIPLRNLPKRWKWSPGCSRQRLSNTTGFAHSDMTRNLPKVPNTSYFSPGFASMRQRPAPAFRERWEASKSITGRRRSTNTVPRSRESASPGWMQEDFMLKATAAGYLRNRLCICHHLGTRRRRECGALCNFLIPG
jgi:hypothetical protein